MTCHAVRFKCATSQKDNPSRVPSPEPPTLPSVVPDRVKQHVLDKFEEVLPGQAQEARVVNSNPYEDGTDYNTGVRRFRDSEDKDAIVEEIERNVVADAEWWVIESHVCTHDENPPSPCPGWSVEKESGNVPDEVK